MGRGKKGQGPRGHRRKSRKFLASEKAWEIAYQKMIDEGWDAATAARAADDAKLRIMKKLPKPER